MKLVLIATSAMLVVAGVAIAQPPSTPMQGSPPNTNTPAAAVPDPGVSADAPANTTGPATAPVTKPMAPTADAAPEATSDGKSHKHKKPQ